jgi:predicted aldo/keto reductase-like oxidoreductase
MINEKIAKLGFGLMRLPLTKSDDWSTINHEATEKLVDLFMENGFSYFDTAYVYHGGNSERFAKKALADRYPRNNFQLATKMPVWILEKASDMDRIFNEQLQRTGVDYFDFYLLHGLSGVVSDRFPSSNTAKADEFGAWDFLKRIKTEGRAKHIGFSFHDSAEALDRLLREHPETEFVQLQINYADWEDPVIQSKACYETARKHGKPVIVMEPVKGGTLANLRPDVAAVFKETNPAMSPASWAIRYAASLDGVLTVLSGMSNIEQMRDNISFMKDFDPLDDTEKTLVEKAVAELRKISLIGCTGCRYCVDGCPKNINIPKVFELINDYRIYKNPAYSKLRYKNGMAGGGKAADCVECGSCENHCPQKLEIPVLLKEAVSLFEEEK